MKIGDKVRMSLYYKRLLCRNKDGVVARRILTTYGNIHGVIIHTYVKDTVMQVEWDGIKGLESWGKMKLTTIAV